MNRPQRHPSRLHQRWTWNQIEKKLYGKLLPIPNYKKLGTDFHRALGIAQQKRAEGDIAGALKFAKKSQALYSNPQTEAFLSTLAETTGSAYASRTSASSTPNGEGPTSRKPKPSEHRQGRQDTQYSKEQIAIVERVRECKRHQYYEILELETKATDSEIKKRYVSPQVIVK